jgi:uncharacterized membrane protein YhdT
MSAELAAALGRLARVETDRDRRLAWALLLTLAYFSAWLVLRFA